LPLKLLYLGFGAPHTRQTLRAAACMLACMRERESETNGRRGTLNPINLDP
jgi:hypothetical protein